MVVIVVSLGACWRLKVTSSSSAANNELPEGITTRSNQAYFSVSLLNDGGQETVPIRQAANRNLQVELTDDDIHEVQRISGGQNGDRCIQPDYSFDHESDVECDSDEDGDEYEDMNGGNNGSIDGRNFG